MILLGEYYECYSGYNYIDYTIIWCNFIIINI